MHKTKDSRTAPPLIERGGLPLSLLSRLRLVSRSSKVLSFEEYANFLNPPFPSDRMASSRDKSISFTVSTFPTQGNLAGDR